jgi:hypothetical protein
VVPLVFGLVSLCVATQCKLHQWVWLLLITGSGIALTACLGHLPEALGIVLFYVLVLHASFSLYSWVLTLGTTFLLLGLFVLGAYSHITNEVIQVQVAAFIIQAALSKSALLGRKQAAARNNELQQVTSDMQHILNLSPDLIVTMTKSILALFIHAR